MTLTQIVRDQASNLTLTQIVRDQASNHDTHPDCERPG